MITKFNHYLEELFSQYVDSPELRELKDKFFEALVNKSAQLKERGIEDENEIYRKSIASLGDVTEELKGFEKKKPIKKTVAEIATVLFGFASAIVCLVAIYLGVSFGVGGIWDKSWLILVGGILASICVLLFIYIIKSANKRPITTRLSALVIIVLTCVIAFLLLQILTDVPKAWIIFLLMVILLLATESLLLYVMKSPIAFVVLIISIPFIFALIYVILSLIEITTWHPYWLIILGGVVVDLVLITVKIVKYNKKK